MFISGKKILLLLLQNRAKGEFHLVRFSKAACLQRVRRGLRVSPDFARKYHWLGIVEKMGFPLPPAPLGFLHEFDSTP